MMQRMFDTWHQSPCDNFEGVLDPLKNCTCQGIPCPLIRYITGTDIMGHCGYVDTYWEMLELTG